MPKARSAKAAEKLPTALDCLKGKGPTRVATAAILGGDSVLGEQVALALVSGWGLDPASTERLGGDEVRWVDVHDKVATRSLFDDGGERVVYVRGADKLLTASREAIEDRIANAKASGHLILDVAKLASNTRIYKQLADANAVIDARLENASTVVALATFWSKSKHHLQLSSEQIDIIVERTDNSFGLLDCELAKLSLFADGEGHVSDEDIDRLVGGWRTKSVFDTADWIADGNAAAVLEELDKLFASGQAAVAVMAQISWSLRRFGVAARLYEQEKSGKSSPRLSDALSRAGFYPYLLTKAEKQLRRIGSARAGQILPWLLELDLQLKSSHSDEERGRWAIEQFVLRLADL